MGAWDVKIFNDSKLVTKQVNGTYQEKNDKISNFKDITMDLLEKFDSYTIDNVP
jgi:ribonuclease HI